MKKVIKAWGIGFSALLVATLWLSPASADVDIQKFKATKKLKLDNNKPLKIDLRLKNPDKGASGTENVTVTVIGKQNNIELAAPCRWTDTVAVVGKKTTKVQLQCTPATEGEITWTVTVTDDNADVDQATATTTAYWKNPPPGPPPPTFGGPGVLVEVSKPANGTHFVAGEAPTVTVVFFDDLSNPLSKPDLSRAWFMVYGPQDQRNTKTSLKLLRASGNRSASPHHYIDLLTNPEAVWTNNTVRYPLSAVTDELAGTYTATVWAVRGADAIQQWMPLVDFQMKTAAVEARLVEKEKCAQCHEGAANGQFYLHHVDVGFSPVGNPALDSWPTRTCKGCHNQDGYAAYQNPDGSRTPDPIVFRAHGVHNGAHLEGTRHEEQFEDYLHVEFPADRRNCTYCHVNDGWKTAPGKLACGTCHADVDFTTGTNHPGGAQATDQFCTVCHSAATIQAKHVDSMLADRSTEYLVELSLTPTKTYTAGDTPTLHIVVKQAATGAVVDPNTITRASWNRGRLQVSGPRESTMPVLTTASADHSKSGSSSYIYNDIRKPINPADDDPRITRSATEITYQLADVAGLKSGTYTVFVQARKASGGNAGVDLLNFQVGTDTVEAQIATACADCHDDTNMHGSYPFRLGADLCKSCHDYENQLSGKTSWNDSNWGYGAAPLSRRVHGVHFGRYLNKPEEVHGPGDAAHFGAIIFPQDVRNCVKCHSESDTWTQKPSRVACLGCHDSDAAIAHGALQTVGGTDAQPYSGDEKESCQVCHGENSAWAPSVVHNIWDPYVPPYPRE